MARMSQSSDFNEGLRPEDYVEPHYKESYRLAVDALVERGDDAYNEFLKREGSIGFLSPAEMEHIQARVLLPKVSEREEGASDRTDGAADDSSSGTYWPMMSDTSVPELDLGWPLVQPHNRGQTNVTLYLHPPLGDGVPTIKQVVRKMVQQATQVIGVVMDVFSDVDIFKDLLDAATFRHVPVYIVLDDVNFSVFRDMCDRFGVRMDKLEYMRVRVTKGTVYYCRSGKKFHGQVFEKMLVVDCNVALCGSYSFTWSYEKINRSIVQVFTGQVVEIFDEEFRVLYGQSETPPHASALYTSHTALDRPTYPQAYGSRKNSLTGSHVGSHVGSLVGSHTGSHVGSHTGSHITEDQASANAYKSFYQGSRDSNYPWANSGSTSSRNLEQSTHQPFERKDYLRQSIDRVYARIQSRQTQLQSDLGTSTLDRNSSLFLSQRAASRLPSYGTDSDAWKRHSYAGEHPESSSFLRSRALFENKDQGSNSTLNRDPSRYRSTYMQDVERAANNAPRRSSLFTSGSRGSSTAEGEFAGTRDREYSRIFGDGYVDKFSKLSTLSREVRQGSQFPSNQSNLEKVSSQPYACETSPTQTNFREQDYLGRRPSTEHVDSKDADNEAPEWNNDHGKSKDTLRRLRINSYLDEKGNIQEDARSVARAVNANRDEGSLSRRNSLDTSIRDPTVQATTTAATDEAPRENSDGETKSVFMRNSRFHSTLPTNTLYKSKSLLDKDVAVPNSDNAESKLVKSSSKFLNKQSSNQSLNTAGNSDDEYETFASKRQSFLSRLRPNLKHGEKGKERGSSQSLNKANSQEPLDKDLGQAASTSNLKGNEKPSVRSLKERYESTSNHEVLQSASREKEPSAPPTPTAPPRRTVSVPSIVDDKTQELAQGGFKKKGAGADDGKKEDSPLDKLKKSLKFRTIFPFAPDKKEEAQALQEGAQKAVEPVSQTKNQVEKDNSFAKPVQQVQQQQRRDSTSASAYTSATSEKAPLPEATSALRSNLASPRRDSLTGSSSSSNHLVKQPDAPAETSAALGRRLSNSSHVSTTSVSSVVSTGSQGAAGGDAASQAGAEDGDDKSDVLLKRIDSMRKEKRVYSRFEVFCKGDKEAGAERPASTATPYVSATSSASTPMRSIFQPRYDSSSLGRNAMQSQTSSYYNTGLGRHSQYSGIGSGGGSGSGYYSGGSGNSGDRYTTPQLLQQRHVPDQSKNEKRLPKFMQRFVVTLKPKNK
ncbi:unnamed protein product [Lampetra planeri]